MKIWGDLKKVVFGRVFVLVVGLAAVTPAHAVVLNILGEVDYADSNPFDLAVFGSVSGVIDWEDSLVTGAVYEEIQFNSVALTFGSEVINGDALNDYLIFENGDLVGMSILAYTSDYYWDFDLNVDSFEFYQLDEFYDLTGSYVSGHFDFSSIAKVPEPGTLLLLVAGMLGLGRFSQNINVNTA